MKKIAKQVQARHVIGIASFEANGIDPTEDWLRRRIPGKYPHQNTPYALEGGCYTAKEFTDAIGLRPQTFYDWSREPDFPEPIPEDWKEDDDPANVSMWLEEEIGIWVFYTRGHRIRHAYAWWVLEQEHGIWVPGHGYRESKNGKFFERHLDRAHLARNM